MEIQDRFALTVTVRRGGGRDRFGDPKPSTTHTISGCVKWPRVTGETDDYSQGVSTGYQLALPPGADIVSTDEVLLPDEPETGPWWQVDGDALDWGPSPYTGRPGGIIVALTRETG